MEIPTKDAPLEATPTALKSILWAWAGVINSHMSMPALRRLREDAGESPPKFGQKKFFFQKCFRDGIYFLFIESGSVFPRGGRKPPLKGTPTAL